MVKIIAAAALALMAAPSQFPADARVRIEEVHTQKHLLLYSGYGKGNVKDANGTRGFDFVFEHCGRFGAGQALAQWTAPHRISIVMPVIGSDSTSRCELKVTEQNIIYYVRDGQMHTRPAEIQP